MDKLIAWWAFNAEAVVSYLAFGVLFATGNEAFHAVKRWIRKM